MSTAIRATAMMDQQIMRMTADVFLFMAYLLSQLKSCSDDGLNRSGDQKDDPGHIPAHGAETDDQVEDCGKSPDSTVDSAEGLTAAAVVFLPFSEITYNGPVIGCIAGTCHVVIDKKARGSGDHKEHQAYADDVIAHAVGNNDR